MKIKNSARSLIALAIISYVNAASTVISQFEIDNGDGTFQSEMSIDTDQTFLGQTTEANGTIVSSYEGIADDLFTFDTYGGTREIDRLEINFGTSRNRYNVYKTAGVEYQGEARANFFAEVRMYNSANELLFTASEINYYFKTYTSAANPIDNFGMDTVTTTGRGVHSFDFQQPTVIDALENGGIRFEIDERVEWSVLDTNGDSIATGLETYADGEFNDYNMFIRAHSSEVDSIPEPSSTALLGLGGLTLIFRRNR